MAGFVDLILGMLNDWAETHRSGAICSAHLSCVFTDTVCLVFFYCMLTGSVSCILISCELDLFLGYAN